MAQFQFRFQTAGNDLNIAPQGPHEDLTLQTLLSFGPNPEGGPALVADIPQLTDVHVSEAWLALGGAGAGGSPVNARTFGDGQWYLEDPAGAQNWFSNGPGPTLQDSSGLQPGGPFFPAPKVLLGGPALASFILPPTDVVAMVRYSRRFASSGQGSSRPWSYQQATAYLDNNKGESLLDPTSFLRRLERSLRVNAGANYSLGVDATGSKINLRACGFAAVDRRHSLWLNSGDIGVGAGQIPPQVASNTVTRCNFHPSSFWPTISGSSRRIELTSRAEPTAAPIDTQAGAPVLLVVDGEVTASRWLFVVDGQAVTTIIKHDDIKRPRDIWNQVIAPAIRANAPGQGLMMHVDENVAGTRTFYPTGILNGLARLTYAHFLEPLGDVPTNVYTWTPQT